MALVIVVAVYDEKAKAFMAPQTYAMPAIAVRAFGHAVNFGETTMAKAPEDFTLFQLGTFDDSSGEFVNHRELLCSGLQVKK